MGGLITKERLDAYPGLRTEIERYQERIAEMKSEEQFPGACRSDGSQHQPGGGGRQERVVLRRIAYEEKMAPLIRSIRAEMQEIEEAVNGLKDPLERLVLHLRYIEGDSIRPKSWADVARQIYKSDDYKSKRAAERLGERAMAHIMASNRVRGEQRGETQKERKKMW